MRNYSQSQRQRCGSINTFVRLSSSWQAGSTSAKKYLAGASMPATSGMQHVSLAKVDGSMCCFSICGQFSHVLLFICHGILTDAMQSCTWLSSTSQTHSLFSFFTCSPNAKLVLFIFFQVFGLHSNFRELNILCKEDWVHAKRQSTSKRANWPTRQTQWRQRWGEKKQWRVKIRNRWNISDCSNTSSTM